MATPKIRIKRGSTDPAATTLTNSGELAVNVSSSTNPKFFIKTVDDSITAPVWVGAAIDGTMQTTPSATRLLTQSGISNYISGLIGSTIGNVTTTTTQTITGEKTFQTNDVILDQVALKFKDSGTDTLSLKAPSNISSSYSLVFPAAQGSVGQILTLSDDTTGALAWAAQTPAISVSEVTDTNEYALVLTNSGGNALYKDGSPGVLPTNGPLTYSKNTGSLTINGNLIVNGPVATAKLTPSANVANGATVISLASTSGLAAGQEIGIFNTAGGATLAAGTVISSIATNTSITLSQAVATATTVSAPNLTNLFVVATGVIDIGPSSSGNDIGNLYNTNVPTINIGTDGSTGATAVNIGKGGVLVSVGDSNANSTVSIKGNTIATLTTNAGTFNLANANATTVNIGGAATALTLGGAASATTNINNIAGATTVNIATGANSSGIKAINIGTNTVSGGTSTIIIGSAVNSSTNNITINGVPRLGANYSHSNITDDKDLATKKYVDLAGGLGITTLNSARAVSTTNVTVNTVTTGSTFGGVTLAAGDRVLLVGQTTATQNGTYVVQASPTGLARPASAETSGATLAKNTYVAITEGTGAGSAYTLSAAAVIGTDNQTWNLFSSAPFAVGNGLLNTSGTLSVKPYTYITVNTDGVSVSGIAGNGTTLGATTGLTVDGQTTVAYATISNLSATYANGSSGVGATLTGSQVAFSIDGSSTLGLGTRILVRSQNNPFENGIYQLSTVGVSSSASWVLTRTTDADTSAELLSIRKVYVTTGTANHPAGRIYNLKNTSITALGTDGINYVGDSFWEGASFTPERYMTIGAPSNLATSTITAKSYNIIGTAQAASVASGGTISINVGASAATNPILDALTPGMRLTYYSFNSGTYFSDSLIIARINRTSTQKVIIVANMSSNTVNFNTTSGLTFTFDGSSSGSENSYVNTPHKGILVYKDASLTNASVLGYNITGNYWSVYNLNSGTPDTTEYKLATQNGIETFTNKTLTSPTITSPTVSGTPSITGDIDLLSGKNLYVYNTGTLNTSTRYRQTALRQDNISLRVISCASDIMYFTPDSSISLRTGNKVTLELLGTWNGISNNGSYYVIYQTPNSIKLATTYADAIAGNTISLSNTTVAAGTTEGYILPEDTSIKLGYSNLGSTGSLYLPTGSAPTYDKIFGNFDDIGTSSSVYTYSSSTNSGFIASAFDYTAYTIIGRDTARSIANIVICANNATTNAVKSIVFDGTSVAKITFTLTLSGNKILTSNDYITLSIGSTVTGLTINEKNALNSFHQVLSSSTVGSDTEVRIQMGQTVAAKTINASGNTFDNIACVKNYEMYINRQNFSGAVGGTLSFSASSGSSLQSGGQTNIASKPRTICGVILATGSYFQLFRLDSIPGGELNPLLGSGTNYMTVSSNNLDMTYTPPNTENITYTGKRVLLNTLIDCGSY